MPAWMKVLCVEAALWLIVATLAVFRVGGGFSGPAKENSDG